MDRPIVEWKLCAFYFALHDYTWTIGERFSDCVCGGRARTRLILHSIVSIARAKTASCQFCSNKKKHTNTHTTDARRGKATQNKSNGKHRWWGHCLYFLEFSALHIESRFVALVIYEQCERDCITKSMQSIVFLKIIGWFWTILFCGKITSLRIWHF